MNERQTDFKRDSLMMRMATKCRDQTLFLVRKGEGKEANEGWNTRCKNEQQMNAT